MTKKDYLLKLLEVVSIDILPIGPDILYLIKNDKVTDDLIDTLYNMFHEYAKTITDKKQKQKIEKTLTFLKKLKTVETKQESKNKKDIQNLEDMLSNI